MSSYVIRGDARKIPLADESVDLVVTSPPYWALRSYRDNGGHYDGQVGSESHPQLWLEAMWGIMAEIWRVLKPSGSVWINLGDKRAGSGGHNNSGVTRGYTARTCPSCGRVFESGRNKCHLCGVTTLMPPRSTEHPATRRNAPDRYEQAAFGRPKSKMLLPHRFAIGCEDGLADPEGIGWIVRQDQVIGKLNGLPESVTDRTRDSHEMFFHMVKQERYFSATDEIREPQTYPSDTGRWSAGSKWTADQGDNTKRWAVGRELNPLGKLPGSVWSVASEPFVVPPDIKARYDLPDHFAAFVGGTELVRRIMLGWSPHAICLTCGEGRRPVVAKTKVNSPVHGPGSITGARNGGPDERGWDGLPRFNQETTILGYSCACTPFTDHPGSGDKNSRGAQGWASQGNQQDNRGGLFNNPKTGAWREYHLEGWTPPPSRSAAVLDPFVGSGTTLLVANALGRTGIGLDLSADYCRLAAWRASQRSEKVISRTWAERQGSLLWPLDPSG